MDRKEETVYDSREEEGTGSGEATVENQEWTDTMGRWVNDDDKLARHASIAPGDQRCPGGERIE